MKKQLLIFSVIFVALLCCGKTFGHEKQSGNKPLYMWFDCEANFERLSHPDSIAYYLNKVKTLGFTDVVVDMKSITGEVLYDSRIAPYMGEWNGTTRPRDYDMLGIFIREGHRLGLKVHASLNIFAGGHNYFNRGIIYTDHPDWQSQVDWHGKIIPISDMKWNYNGMLNPVNPDVQNYELRILDEFATKYPALDGVILDRARFDGISSDFSDLSRKAFEAYSGITLKNFPEDILTWKEDNAGKWTWGRGPYFNQWVEWRSMVIRNFMGEVRKHLKKVNPKLAFGDYTGAWYPTYYEVGVNWASKDYDPSKEFDWATPDYKKTGYAELLDIYMTGLYYTLVTKDEVDHTNTAVGARTEPGMDQSRNYWYCIEGGAELVKELICGKVPVTGSVYVDQYENDAAQFQKAVTQTIRSCDGLMLFDIVHIINRNWWNVLAQGIDDARTSGTPSHDTH